MQTQWDSPAEKWTDAQWEELKRSAPGWSDEQWNMHKQFAIDNAAYAKFICRSAKEPAHWSVNVLPPSPHHEDEGEGDEEDEDEDANGDEGEDEGEEDEDEEEEDEEVGTPA